MESGLNGLSYQQYKKVVIFGVKKSGKSTLIERMEKSTFKEDYEQEEEENKETFESKRLSIQTKDKKGLNMDIVSVKIDSEEYTEYANKSDLIETIVFESQCVIYLVDITNKNSLSSIEEVDKLIKKDDHITKILLVNKTDLEDSRGISNEDINTFSKSDKMIKIELSLKLISDNYNTLLSNIYNALYKNSAKPIYPYNYMSHSGINNSNKSLTNSIELNKTYKIVLLGETAVGKTAFVKRYSNNEFSLDSFSTIGINDDVSVIKINNDFHKLTLWDTAGQERFQSISKKYYTNADGILIIFDVCSKESFDKVNNWMQDIRENCKIDENNHIPIYLLGNKIDLLEGREIEKKRAAAEAKNLGVKYFEISCYANLNINETLSNMISELASKNKEVHGVQLVAGGHQEKERHNGGCCGGNKH